MSPRLHLPDGDPIRPSTSRQDSLPTAEPDPYAAYRQPSRRVPGPRRNRPAESRPLGRLRQELSRSPLLLRGTIVAGLVAAAGVSLLRAQAPAPTTSAAGLALAPRTAPVSAGIAPEVESCRVLHTVTSRSRDRFTAVVTVVNTGRSPVRGWTLRWAYGDGGPEAVPRLSDGWKATVTMDATGGQAIDIDPDAVIPAGGSTTIGFVGTGAGTAPDPTSFTLNGVSCR